MQPPPPDDPQPPPPTPTPAPTPILDYEPPSPPARSDRRPLSKVAVAALVTALAAAYAAATIMYAVFGVGPRATVRWVALWVPLLPWVSIALSVNALLRTADPRENVSGDTLAWIALLLSLISALVGGCCLGLSLMGNAA